MTWTAILAVALVCAYMIGAGTRSADAAVDRVGLVALWVLVALLTAAFTVGLIWLRRRKRP